MEVISHHSHAARDMPGDTISVSVWFVGGVVLSGQSSSESSVKKKKAAGSLFLGGAM